MNKPITEEEVAKTIEFNKKILPILKSGFEYGDGFDEHYVAEQIREIITQATNQAYTNILELKLMEDEIAEDDRDVHGDGVDCYITGFRNYFRKELRASIKKVQGE